jgi:2-(3-amino-3-carboxypropyl)histidine synthase
MKVMFIPAEYQEKVRLSKELISYLKANRLERVGVFCAAQFCGKIKEAEKQLNSEGIITVSSVPKRASCRGQLLGCDVFEDSLNLDSENDLEAYLYIGDGKFHPLALAYSQANGKQGRWKKVICYDPLSKRISLIENEEIDKVMKKYKAGILKFIQAKEIGVIISSKWGQEQYKKAKQLEKRYTNKRFYFFLDDNISFGQLENFPFIEVWVNSACPRIAIDEMEKFNRKVINLNDALEPLKTLERMENRPPEGEKAFSRREEKRKV